MSLEQTPSEDQVFVGSGSIEELLSFLNQQLLERPDISPDKAIQSTFAVLRVRTLSPTNLAEAIPVINNEAPRLLLRDRLRNLICPIVQI